MDFTLPTIDYQAEVLRRRDMRDVFTFTIDPSTAKDFDDAISCQPLEDNLIQVGVHIADVSFFVPYGSEMDEQAYEKGNSVYLVDEVIPMLPKQLSNHLCSLMPDEDRLCMSVVFTLTQDGDVKKYKICRTIIHSDARLNYDQAQDIILHQSTLSDFPSPIYNILPTLSNIAAKLRAKRMAAGALDIETEEIRFELNDEGRPTRIIFELPNEAHHLIEEFMLLANRTVAEHVGKVPFIYRIHDKPDEEKLEDLKHFSNRPFRITEDPAIRERAIDMLRIRAQAKAVYSTHNIGHYGLHFPYYTHFTSPIRRYPDLMVHRLLDQYVLKGKKESFPKSELEQIAQHCSETEQTATQMERDSIKYYQTLYMQDHLGEEFDGHIVNVTSFGVFVRLDENHCEGLVHISKLDTDDYLTYDEKNYRILSERTGNSFTLGDPIRVRVIKADALKSQIDFLPVL